MKIRFKLKKTAILVVSVTCILLTSSLGFDPGSPWVQSICFDTNPYPGGIGQCLWTRTVAGVVGVRPDTSDEDSDCWNGGPMQYGDVHWFSSFAGSQWQYICCYSDEGFGGGGSGGQCDPEWEVADCGFNGSDPLCGCETPIIISVRGNRLDLTDAANGVEFDLNADGIAERLSWTEAGGDDAFLVLDRNANGFIDNGAELFGNYTPQPALPYPNGFKALAVYDDPAEGGNGDGKISLLDAVFGDLRLWLDLNHDGVSQPNELRLVSRTPIRAFNLEYRRSRRQDEHGNLFRFIAVVEMKNRPNTPRRKFAVDVFLLTGE